MTLSPAPLVILQISDLHLLTKSGQKMAGMDTEESFCQVLKYAHEKHENIDLILVTGDLAQQPCQFSYQRIAKELEKYSTRTLCLPGNHDDPLLMQQLINSEHVNCGKQLRLNQWQIICLNSIKPGSEGGFLALDELSFLSKTLTEHADINTLIAVHHNPVPTQSAWLDTMTIENSEIFLSLLNEHPQVKVITFGHIHQELEVQTNKQLLLGIPSTCFQFKPNSEKYALDDKKAGYRILQLYPNGTVNSKVFRLP